MASQRARAFQVRTLPCVIVFIDGVAKGHLDTESVSSGFGTNLGVHLRYHHIICSCRQNQMAMSPALLLGRQVGFEGLGLKLRNELIPGPGDEDYSSFQQEKVRKGQICPSTPLYPTISHYFSEDVHVFFQKSL